MNTIDRSICLLADSKFATPLSDILKPEQEVRIHNGFTSSKWAKAKITKIHKRSFETLNEHGKAQTFKINTWGGIYLEGEGRSNSRFTSSLSFDVEGIDQRQEAEDNRRKTAGEAIELRKQIDQRLDSITPRNFTYSVYEADLEKLKQALAILSA